MDWLVARGVFNDSSGCSYSDRKFSIFRTGGAVVLHAADAATLLCFARRQEFLRQRISPRKRACTEGEKERHSDTNSIQFRNLAIENLNTFAIQLCPGCEHKEGAFAALR